MNKKTEKYKSRLNVMRLRFYIECTQQQWRAEIEKNPKLAYSIVDLFRDVDLFGYGYTYLKHNAKFND